MKPTTLPADLEAAFERFRDENGVVEYFVFESANESDVHLNASLEAFQQLKRDYQTFGFELTVKAELMKCCVVNLEQFLGSLTSAGPVNSPKAYLEARATRLESKSFVKQIGYGGLPDGYIQAFCDPPYTLCLSPTDAQSIYETISSALFGSFNDDLEIMRWSNDWSNYFEAGLEWWGAFWWTVHNRTKGLIVVVAASATD